MSTRTMGTAASIYFRGESMVLTLSDDKKPGKCLHCGKRCKQYFCSSMCRLARRRLLTSMRWKKPETFHRRRIEKAAYRRRLKEKALQIVGSSCCEGCGIDDIRVLTINHTTGKTEHDVFRSKRRPDKIRSGHVIYSRIVSGERQTEDLSVLCMNCNILYEYKREKRVILQGDVERGFR